MESSPPWPLLTTFETQCLFCVPLLKDRKFDPLLYSLHFQDAQKGVNVKCAKKKTDSHKRHRSYPSLQVETSTLCTSSEIPFPNPVPQEGSPGVLCWWGLAPSLSKWCIGFSSASWRQITQTHSSRPSPGFLRALMFCSHLLYRASALSVLVMRHGFKAFNITTVWQTEKCLSP